MASSSLAPMRRYRSSCLPALLSKNHLPAQRVSGTGNGQSSSPTSRNARAPVFGIDRNALLLARLGGEIRGVFPVLRHLAAHDDIVPVWAEDLSQGSHVETGGRLDQRVGRLLRGIEHLHSGRSSSRRGDAGFEVAGFAAGCWAE